MHHMQLMDERQCSGEFIILRTLCRADRDWHLFSRFLWMLSTENRALTIEGCAKLVRGSDRRRLASATLDICMQPSLFSKSR